MSYREWLFQVLPEFDKYRQSHDFAEDILHQLDRIYSSELFRMVHENTRRILAYVVAMEQVGRSLQIKEKTIGEAVYCEKGETYDPLERSTVRVAVRELRPRLIDYFDSVGINDPIRITLPANTFEPKIDELHPIITVEVTPTRDWRNEDTYIAASVSAEIVMNLKRFGAVRSRLTSDLKDADRTPHYEVSGTLTSFRDDAQIHIILIDKVGPRNISGEIFRSTRAALMGAARPIARQVLKMIAAETKGWSPMTRIPEIPEAFSALEATEKGFAHLRQRTDADIRRAIGYFEKAIRDDPQQARAHAGFAMCILLLSWYGSGTPDRSWLNTAKTLAEKAVALNPRCAEARTALAFAKLLANFDWAGAETEFKNAISINERYAPARHWYSELLGMQSRFEEARAQLNWAFKIDRGSHVIRKSLGDPDYYTGDYDTALTRYQASLKMHPDFWMSHLFLGWTYQQLGETAKALHEFETVASQKGMSSIVKGALGHLYATTGDEKKALNIVASLLDDPHAATVAPHTLAVIWAGLGDKDKAFEWLAASYERPIELLGWIKVDPRFVKIRTDPRFNEFLGQVGLLGSPSNVVYH